MSLSVDGVWKAGVWATTVWGEGVWREGDAPTPSPSPAPAEVTGGGNWSAFFHYEQERERRRRRRRDEEEAKEAAEALPPVDREIAQILQKQEREDAKRQDVERLRKLVQEFTPSEGLPKGVNEAIQRAKSDQRLSAILRLDRELKRMLEDEELAVLFMLMSD